MNFPDTEITLDQYPFPFHTRLDYLKYFDTLITIERVQMNFYIPSNLLDDNDMVGVTSELLSEDDYEICLVDIFEFVLFGIKWETTIQALARRIGLSEAILFDEWIMHGDYRRETGDLFPLFGISRP